MKKLLIIGNLLLIGIMVHAQTPDAFGDIKTKNVPKKVLESYQSLSLIKVDEWGAFKNRYQATTKKDKHRTYYRFNDEGLYKETLVKLNWEKDAPNGIREGKSRIEQKYWEVKEFYEVTTDSGDVTYILVLENKDEKLATVYFDNGGSLQDKSSFQ